MFKIVRYNIHLNISTIEKDNINTMEDAENISFEIAKKYASQIKGYNKKYHIYSSWKDPNLIIDYGSYEYYIEVKEY